MNDPRDKRQGPSSEQALWDMSRRPRILEEEQHTDCCCCCFCCCCYCYLSSGCVACPCLRQSNMTSLKSWRQSRKLVLCCFVGQTTKQTDRQTSRQTDKTNDQADKKKRPSRQTAIKLGTLYRVATRTYKSSHSVIKVRVPSEVDMQNSAN